MLLCSHCSATWWWCNLDVYVNRHKKRDKIFTLMDYLYGISFKLLPPFSSYSQGTREILYEGQRERRKADLNMAWSKYETEECCCCCMLHIGFSSQVASSTMQCYNAYKNILLQIRFLCVCVWAPDRVGHSSICSGRTERQYYIIAPHACLVYQLQCILHVIALSASMPLPSGYIVGGSTCAHLVKSYVSFGERGRIFACDYDV